MNKPTHKPFSHRLLHAALLVLEVALLWVLISFLVQPETLVSGGTLVAVLLVFFVLNAHLIALALQYIVPKFPVERHSFAILVSILGSILVAVMVSYGIIIGISYVAGLSHGMINGY